MKNLKNNVARLVYASLLSMLTLFTLNSCESFDVPALEFVVTTTAETYTAGEEVQFLFEGKEPRVISFFSGEPGNDYAFANQDRIDQVVSLRLSFETHNAETEPLPDQSSATFSVMMSSDFNGTYDYEHVADASWIDITDRFTMAQPHTWGGDLGWFTSGTAELSDLIESGKEFYIAFKYTVPPGLENPGSMRWRMRRFNLARTMSLGASDVIGTYNRDTWELVKRDENLITPSQKAASIFLFGPSGDLTDGVEEWGISYAFPAEEVNLGPDYGVALKGYLNTDVVRHSHVYTEPGKYRATFVASNTTVYDSKVSIQHVDITILPASD